MILFYQGDEKMLYFFDSELYKVDYADEELKKLTFEEFIREVDTCPDEAEKWKREIIIRAAELIGMLKGVA